MLDEFHKSLIVQNSNKLQRSYKFYREYGVVWQNKPNLKLDLPYNQIVSKDIKTKIVKALGQLYNIDFLFVLLLSWPSLEKGKIGRMAALQFCVSVAITICDDTMTITIQIMIKLLTCIFRWHLTFKLKKKIEFLLQSNIYYFLKRKKPYRIGQLKLKRQWQKQLHHINVNFFPFFWISGQFHYI